MRIQMRLRKLKYFRPFNLRKISYTVSTVVDSRHIYSKIVETFLVFFLVGLDYLPILLMNFSTLYKSFTFAQNIIIF